MRSEIVQSFRFEAAHFLPNVPEGHRCKRIHGHSYRIDVHVEGEVDPQSGWVVDFFDVEAAFTPVFSALDHQLLNDIEGLENPTAEHIAVWVWEHLEGLSGLSCVTVHETELSRAIYRGPS